MLSGGISAALFEWLPAYGPWLVFALSFLESFSVVGLVVPSGVAISVATILALRGELSLLPVLGAAAAGGAVGDSVGFWIGRFGGRRLLEGRGRLARSTAVRLERMGGILSRRPVYSVSLARLIAFVRTLMPFAAGMSGLSYPHFVAYELVGLVGWVGLYAGLGFLAGESWELATQVVGVGGAVIFTVLAYVFITSKRRGRGHGPGEEDAC